MNISACVAENALIKKELSLKNGRIEQISFTDKRNDRTLTLPDGSQELSLCFRLWLRRITVNASDLQVASFLKTQEGFTLSFKPFAVADSLLNLSIVYILPEGKTYIRKYIELSFEKQGRKKLILDHIAFEYLSVPEKASTWSVPDQRGSHIPGYALSLGQPIYLDNLYMGSEFPAALNCIEQGFACCRYYSGKALTELIGSDKYISHKSVMGCADGSIFQQVQKAFFSYIRDISRPVRLRRQYNSWYDHMLNITHENVNASFLEIDKGLTASGEGTLDSYVADDGWNDYSKGFWCFNDKFPQELYPFRDLAKALGSEFGLWVGPRGGYTTDTIKFARHIQKAGNGYVNRSSIDICVASEKYVKRMSEMMQDFENRFDLNYFKLDGFAQKPCRNRRHDHMTGGKDNAYFYTDTWEKWIGVFKKLNENGSDNFWINLTCYAPPSPWYLQWVNSLWMQISDDVGFIGEKGKSSDKDRMLSYRDEKYFDFYRIRQFQFPQRALYNHDPIYGNEAKVSMSDEDFRSYLFTMATRGTAFWELYYSFNMMNENKWRINYSVLRFLEENMDVLANSVIFGSRPSEKGVYGFSCFNESEGIISLRNSSDKPQSYSLLLDEKIGVANTFGSSDTYILLPYTPTARCGAFGYGDTLETELAPYETKIFHLGKKALSPEAIYVRARDAHTLEVQFSCTANIQSLTCDENPVKSLELLADYRTVVITFENALGSSNSLTLKGVGDITGCLADIPLSFTCFPEGEAEYLEGPYDFSLSATVTDTCNFSFFSQGEAVSLSSDSRGCLTFKVGDCLLASETELTAGDKLCAVRERNNVIKLYINGKLDCGRKAPGFSVPADSISACEGLKVCSRALSFDEIP